jgi:hypothetical protein
MPMPFWITPQLRVCTAPLALATAQAMAKANAAHIVAAVFTRTDAIQGA